MKKFKDLDQGDKFILALPEEKMNDSQPLLIKTNKLALGHASGSWNSFAVSSGLVMGISEDAEVIKIGG